MRDAEERFTLQYVGNAHNSRMDKEDPEVGHIVHWTMAEILDEINRDHSAEWIDYDRTDWKEGLTEWTEYRPFPFRCTKFYVVRAVFWEEGRGLKEGLRYPVRVYADTCGTFTEWNDRGAVSAEDRAAALCRASKFPFLKAVAIADEMNASTWAKQNGYTFRVYPAKEFNDPLK